MWDTIKEVLSIIWELLGFLVLAVLLSVAVGIAKIIEWLFGSDSEKKQDE